TRRPSPDRYEAYCTAGARIHEELRALGGLSAASNCAPRLAADATTPILHLATAEGLSSGERLEGDALLQELARRYVAAMEGHGGAANRGPAETSQLRPGEPHGYRIPFNPTGTGCGAAMRSLAIGLRSGCGRWGGVSPSNGDGAHPPPTPLQVPGRIGRGTVWGAGGAWGYPLSCGGAELLRILPHAWDYVEGEGVAVEENAAAWDFFGDTWRRYLESRGLLGGGGPPRVPSLPTPEERDAEYVRWALGGWAGRSGHDAPMVALEALLAAGDSWEELCARAVLHGGDNDSTGTIAAGCWGLRWGLSRVPPGMHRHLEYRQRLCHVAHRLHALAWGH
uniref:ADP-ribosylarginine hydrolase n=1 Tax=Gallus gallus TaxID=9031 RepID=A0A8V1A669_CHICK